MALLTKCLPVTQGPKFRSLLLTYAAVVTRVCNPALAGRRNKPIPDAHQPASLAEAVSPSETALSQKDEVECNTGRRC